MTQLLCTLPTLPYVVLSTEIIIIIIIITQARFFSRDFQPLVMKCMRADSFFLRGGGGCLVFFCLVFGFPEGGGERERERERAEQTFSSRLRFPSLLYTFSQISLFCSVLFSFFPHSTTENNLFFPKPSPILIPPLSLSLSLPQSTKHL